MRLIRAAATLAVLFFATGTMVRAEYVALKNGQRLHVTSYELLGDKYRLKVAGGTVEVPADEVLSIEPEDTFAALPAVPAPLGAPPADSPFQDFVKAAAARYAVDEGLISSMIAAESNFNPRAVSRKNARGLMQLMPGTASQFGVRNIFDPQENIDAGTHYLSDLLRLYNNNLPLALAAYNAGPQRVTQFGRVPPFNETISYVRRVKSSYEKNKAGRTPVFGATSLPQNGFLQLSKDTGLSLFQEAAKSAPSAASTTPQSNLPN